jgi:large subunit ribosomal protein L24
MKLTLTLLRYSYYRHLPKSYIQRQQQIEVERNIDRRFGAPPLVKWKRKPEDWENSEERPWTQIAQMQNLDVNRRLPVQEQPLPEDEFPICLGDIVQVMVGRDKGKQGRVAKVMEHVNKVYVHGLSTELKEMQGRTVSLMQALSITKQEVMLVDPLTRKPTEIEWRYTERGLPIRISLSTGKEIPVPNETRATHLYRSAENYIESAKDTPVKALLKTTFVMPSSTFEEEIMRAMGIEENRRYGKTYWWHRGTSGVPT